MLLAMVTAMPRSRAKMNWIRLCRGFLFPRITRRKACAIAFARLAPQTLDRPLVCHAKLPENYCLYLSSSEPCWYITAPWGDSLDSVVIRSARVIIIGRTSGIVHYDGSAHDEG